ncbi:MAPEG family protein [bacterium]|nr:MAPEG family protein [bacterium]
MTIELFCLMLGAVLAASLWIPYIVGVNITPAAQGAPNVFVSPPDPLKMKPWIARSFRAHQNLLEQFLPFAVVVLTAHLVGVSNDATRWAAIAFVVIRIAHAVGMITAVARMPLRPLLFTSGYAAILVIASQVFLGATGG